MVLKEKSFLKTAMAWKVAALKLLKSTVSQTFLLLLKRAKIWPKNSSEAFLFAGPQRLDISQNFGCYFGF